MDEMDMYILNITSKYNVLEEGIKTNKLCKHRSKH